MALPVPFANIATITYYENTQPFIDRMKVTTTEYDRRSANNSAGNGGDGWYHDYTGGFISWKPIHSRAGLTRTYRDLFPRIKPGTYIAKWTGGFDVELSGNFGGETASYQTGAGLISANRYGITITDERGELYYRVRSPSAGTAQGSLTDLVVLPLDQESRYLAGEIFDSDYLDAYGHYECLRFMDAFSAYSMGVSVYTGYDSVEREDYAQEADRSYSLRWPPSIAAKLCKKLGCDMWLSFPTKGSRQCMRDFLQEIYDTGFLGNIYCEFGNEYWNVASAYTAQRTWLANVKAQGLDVDGDGNPITCYTITGATAAATGNNAVCSAAGLGACQLWYEAEQIFGRSRVKRVIAGQHIFPDSSKQHFYVVNPFTGNRVYQDVDVYAVAPYLFVGTTETIPSNFAINLWRQQAWNLSGTDLLNAFKAYIDTFLGDSIQAQNENMLASFGSSAVIHSYEAGPDVFNQSRSDQIISAERWTVDGNSLVIVDSTKYARYNTGELVGFSGLALDASNVKTASSPSSQMAAAGWYYCRKHSSTKMWLYPDLAAYNADTTPNGTGAISMDTPTVGYRYFLMPFRVSGAVCWGDTANNELDFGMDITNMWADGEKILLSINQSVENENGNSTKPGSAWAPRTEYFVKLSGTNKLRVFSNQANYDADTEMAITDGTNIFWVNNMTRYYLLDAWIKSNMDGEMGRDLYEYAIARIFDGHIASFNQFVGSSSYAESQMWGIRQDEYNEPSLRALYLYSLDSRSEEDTNFGVPRKPKKRRKDDIVRIMQKIAPIVLQ